MPHTRTPWSLQSKHPGNGQGTIGSADCPRSLHPEKCPKEVGALGFRCLPCFCHKLWVRKWPEWHHLPSELDPGGNAAPDLCSSLSGVLGGGGGLARLPCLRRLALPPRSGGQLLNPSLVLLFGSLLIVSLIGTSRFMIKIKPTG